MQGAPSARDRLSSPTQALHQPQGWLPGHGNEAGSSQEPAGFASCSQGERASEQPSQDSSAPLFPGLSDTQAADNVCSEGKQGEGPRRPNLLRSLQDILIPMAAVSLVNLGTWGLVSL